MRVPRLLLTVRTGVRGLPHRAVEPLTTGQAEANTSVVSAERSHHDLAAARLAAATPVPGMGSREHSPDRGEQRPDQRFGGSLRRQHAATRAGGTARNRC